MGFSRQECWSGLPLPSPGDLPNPGIRPGSPALQADSLPLSHQGNLTTLRNSYKWTYINEIIQYLSFSDWLPHLAWCPWASVVVQIIKNLPAIRETQVQSWHLIKNHLTLSVSIYFWALYSIPLVCMSIFMPVPLSFDYHSFTVSFYLFIKIYLFSKSIMPFLAHFPFRLKCGVLSQMIFWALMCRLIWK